MLLLLFIPIYYAVACLYRYLHLFAPSNMLIARVRNLPPSWRTAALLLALAYALIWAAHRLSNAIEAGSPGWLNLVVLMLAWDAIKVGCLATGVALRSIAAVAHSSVARVGRRSTARLRRVVP